MAIQLQRDLGFDKAGWQRLVDSVIQLVLGRQNSIGDVKLTAGAALTTVSFQNCSKDCRVFLFPQTANAAAAVATTYILKTEIGQGSFIIRHANAGTTDRDFSFLCIGG